MTCDGFQTFKQCHAAELKSQSQLEIILTERGSNIVKTLITRIVACPSTSAMTLMTLQACTHEDTCRTQ